MRRSDTGRHLVATTVDVLERVARRLAVAAARPLDGVDRKVTVVVAAHPDDETLGCGGTIARQRAAGTRVVVIIATDGQRSDREHRPGQEVADVRRAEARAALGALGVPAEDITFLGLTDAELAFDTRLTHLIAAELARAAPDLVLVCAAGDGHPDHVAAQRATVAAQAAVASTATLLEYPIWAWVDWPWAVVPWATGVRRVIAPVAAVAAARPVKVALGPYRTQKRTALACYRSQLGTAEAGAGEGLPPAVLALFDSGTELFLRSGAISGGGWLRPGSPLRRVLRERFPKVRDAVLAPRRWRTNRRWRRIHQQVSKADRPILEEQILPALAAGANGRPVLFVGVEWYTAAYHELFPPAGFVTIDIDERKASYGAPEHHVLDARHVGEAFADGRFAAVVCNGVLGWGLNEPDDIALCFEGFRRVLAPQGVLVLGWNDTDERRPPPLPALLASAGFEPAAGAGLGGSRVDVGNELRHVYAVYRRV
jgi:LmbE family N-acetylglucosaminyl deacetylase